MHNVIRASLLTCAAVLLLSACTPKAPEPVAVDTPLKPVATTLATATADAGMLASSTVRPPKLPTFPQGRAFVVDKTGAGKASALFVAPAPSQEPWHRVAKFTVDQTIIDGVWVNNLTFEGRLNDDTVITTQEQVAFGSNSFITVSRRVSDILGDNPGWRGLDDGARVSVTFTRHGNGPVRVLSVTGLEPVFRSATLAAPGPVYSFVHATDPIMRNALFESDGETASIIGYQVDFANPGSSSGPMVELVVGKTGPLYLQVGMMSRPRGAFGRQADPRIGPESTDEAAARKTAVANAERTVRRIPQFSAATGTVFGYLVRVVYVDGTYSDVFVENNGRVSEGRGRAKLQPWGPTD